MKESKRKKKRKKKWKKNRNMKKMRKWNHVCGCHGSGNCSLLRKIKLIFDSRIYCLQFAYIRIDGRQVTIANLHSKLDF